MKCQICENPATVHLSETVNKKKRELHLCERCARERNLIPEQPGPQIDLKALLHLLMNPFPGSAEAAEDSAQVPGACEVCGLTLAEFKAEGRLGASTTTRRCGPRSNRCSSASTDRPRTRARRRGPSACANGRSRCKRRWRLKITRKRPDFAI